jgi:hypothetical protein
MSVQTGIEAAPFSGSICFEFLVLCLYSALHMVHGIEFWCFFSLHFFFLNYHFFCFLAGDTTVYETLKTSKFTVNQ